MSQYDAAILALAPDHFWLCSETGSPLADSGSSSSPLTEAGNGTATYHTALAPPLDAIPAGFSILCDGTGQAASPKQFVNTSITCAPDNWTFGGFYRVKTGTGGSAATIAWYGDRNGFGHGTNGFGLGWDATGLLFSNVTSTFRPDAQIALDTWHHLALRRSSTVLTLWLDGVKQSASTTALGGGNPFTQLIVGNDFGATTGAFESKIDFTHVVMAQRAFTDAQMQTLAGISGIGFAANLPLSGVGS